MSSETIHTSDLDFSKIGERLFAEADRRRIQSLRVTPELIKLYVPHAGVRFRASGLCIDSVNIPEVMANVSALASLISNGTSERLWSTLNDIDVQIKAATKPDLLACKLVNAMIRQGMMI